MRKYLIFFIFLFSFGAEALAGGEALFENESSVEPIKRGDILIDGGFSASYIVEGAAQSDSKKQVYGGAFRALYALNSRVYLGFEGVFDRGDMSSSPLPYGPEYSGSDVSINIDENTYSVRAGFLASRFNFNPASAKRIYFPLGIGYMYRKQTTVYKMEPGPSAPPGYPGLYYSLEKAEKTGDGLALYGGLGFEYDFSNHILGGVEARYFIFKSGGDMIKSVSLLLKVGFRS